MIIFDCDGDTPEDEPGKPTGKRKKQEDDNKALFSLMNLTSAPFPTDVVWAKDIVAWPTKIGDIVRTEIGKEELIRLQDKVREDRGINIPNMEKNALFIGYVMAEAWSEGKKSKTLEKLCEHIVNFAESVYPPVK